jgi:hypothetical protein
MWRCSAAAYHGAGLLTGGDRRAAAAAREGEQRELDSGTAGRVGGLGKLYGGEESELGWLL